MFAPVILVQKYLHSKLKLVKVLLLKMIIVKPKNLVVLAQKYLHSKIKFKKPMKITKENKLSKKIYLQRI